MELLGGQESPGCSYRIGTRVVMIQTAAPREGTMQTFSSNALTENCQLRSKMKRKNKSCVFFHLFTCKFWLEFIRNNLLENLLYSMSRLHQRNSVYLIGSLSSISVNQSPENYNLYLCLSLGDILFTWFLLPNANSTSSGHPFFAQLLGLFLFTVRRSHIIYLGVK